MLELSPNPPRTGELFEVRTRLTETSTGRPVSGARFSLEATMPGHAHGMITRPEHRALPGGVYLSEGMKLHMPGRWRFEVRVRAGERADDCRVDFEQPP